MVGVRFELKTNDPWSVDDAICEALVRWATGERFNNRLPKLSLTRTLSPPTEQRDSWSSYGALRAYSEVLS